MEKSINFENFINNNFKISIVFFAIGLFFGIGYSLNLIGFIIDSQTLNPANLRAVHISLMLYGGPFRILCQLGKIKNTKGHKDENRNRCRAIC